LESIGGALRILLTTGGRQASLSPPGISFGHSSVEGLEDRGDDAALARSPRSKGGWTMIGLLLVSVLAAAAPPTPAVSWEISGELAEACTCKVPCTCQFGQGPSPGPGCRSLITMSIEKGHRGDAVLDGAKLAVAHGNKATVFYIDSAASAPQRAALKAVAESIAATSKWKSVVYREARISQSLTPTEIRGAVEGAGGFEAEVLIGSDGKSPVVVENQGDVNIARLEKGKTRSLKYADTAGNAIDAKDTNSDRGHFDWSDRTESFF
jgi:hypothetical protein